MTWRKHWTHEENGMQKTQKAKKLAEICHYLEIISGAIYKLILVSLVLTNDLFKGF